jgi:hypothetical protein
VKNDFFDNSKAHRDGLRSCILVILPGYLPSGGRFIGGAEPGEDDFHVAAWLARIASVGAEKTEQGLGELEKEASSRETGQVLECLG